MAKITDRVVVGATHVGRSDRGDRVHVTGPGARGETRDFKADGFDPLAPKLRGGRPPTFTLPQRQQVKKIALAGSTDHDLPLSTWSLSKLAGHPPL